MGRLFFIIKLTGVHIKFHRTTVVAIVCLCYFFSLYLLLGECFYKAVNFVVQRSCYFLVYLEKDISPDGIENLQQQIAQFPNVIGVNFISSRESLNQLSKELKIDLTKVISQEDLSASFEVYFGGGLQAFSRATQLIAELSHHTYIREIVYNKELINFLKTVIFTTESIYWGFGVILSLLVFYLLMCIFRLNIRRHHEQFYLLRLHGTDPALISISNAISSASVFLFSSTVALLFSFLTQYFIIKSIGIENMWFFLEAKVIFGYIGLGTLASSIIGVYVVNQLVRN